MKERSIYPKQPKATRQTKELRALLAIAHYLDVKRKRLICKSWTMKMHGTPNEARAALREFRGFNKAYFFACRKIVTIGPASKK